MRIPSLIANKIRTRRFALTAAALAGMFAPLSARADVIYSFNQVANPGYPSVNFALDVANFIATDTIFTPGTNFSCTATGTFYLTGKAQTCLSAEFKPGPSFDRLTVLFTDTSTAINFALGDFSHVGTYTLPLATNTISNSLTVALARTATAVPEPVTLSLFAAGLAAGMAGLRGTRVRRAVRTA